MKNFRSEITSKNKILDLKSDLRNRFLHYNLCISSKKWSFHFLMILLYKIMFRLTSGQKTSKYFHKQCFFEINFLFNCVKKFSKTVRRQ